ncbi:MAG: hypothetical protein DHS20C18_38660 [Saprospiraceae bacterium]|nr:MAG: hypothetical protein DHS20C18_38660 [Saprospiraceae bacterium]
MISPVKHVHYKDKLLGLNLQSKPVVALNLRAGLFFLNHLGQDKIEVVIIDFSHQNQQGVA